jgi:hypothetical protein
MSLWTYNYFTFSRNFNHILAKDKAIATNFRKNIDEREPFFCGISFFFIHKTFCNFAPTGIPYTAPSDRAFSGGQGAGLS